MKNFNKEKNNIFIFGSEGYIGSVLKDELKNVTAKAVELGIFGAPSFLVDGKLFFGQDRMQWFLN